jgi:hypothetical protein
MKLPSSVGSGSQAFSEIGSPEREADILRASVQLLRRYLPSAWELDSAGIGRSRGADAELRVRAPDGQELVALAEVKRLISTRDVQALLDRLRQDPRAGGVRPPTLLLIARYLAPATRERIVQAGAGYLDLTGNLYVAADSPPLVLRDRGADKDPWRGPGRPRGTLKGAPAARMVRALVDFRPPYSVPEVAARAATSIGAAYRVVGFLEEQQLLTRDPRGPITAVRWRAMLERWSRDYGFTQANTVATFLEPRGLPALEERLRAQPALDYALTGSLAMERVAPFAPTRLAMMHVRDIAVAANALGLRPTSAGGNVILASGDDEVAFARTQEFDGLCYAAWSQVAVDLLTAPGRSPSEAMALLDWMESHETDWRR